MRSRPRPRRDHVTTFLAWLHASNWRHFGLLFSNWLDTAPYDRYFGRHIGTWKWSFATTITITMPRCLSALCQLCCVGTCTALRMLPVQRSKATTWLRWGRKKAQLCQRRAGILLLIFELFCWTCALFLVRVWKESRRGDFWDSHAYELNGLKTKTLFVEGNRLYFAANNHQCQFCHSLHIRIMTTITWKTVAFEPCKTCVNKY